MNPIRVAIAGTAGRMGTEAYQTLRSHSSLSVAGVLVRQTGQAQFEVPTYDDPETLMVEQAPDVWLDLTDASSVVEHIDLAIAHGIRPVVGATGYLADDIERWQHRCTAEGIGGIVAPNFAVGALLMMRFAAEAARFLPDVEIIELHHNGKKDAPSGTARRTAATVAKARLDAATGTALSAPADDMAERGTVVDGIPVHSIRLPGLVAHQEVIFGGTGEVLTIRHDSMSRTSFMPGIVAACTAVVNLQGLVYGLEHILW